MPAVLILPGHTFLIHHENAQTSADFSDFISKS